MDWLLPISSYLAICIMAAHKNDCLCLHVGVSTMLRYSWMAVELSFVALHWKVLFLREYDLVMAHVRLAF